MLHFSSVKDILKVIDPKIFEVSAENVSVKLFQNFQHFIFVCFANRNNVIF